MCARLSCTRPFLDLAGKILQLTAGKAQQSNSEIDNSRPLNLHYLRLRQNLQDNEGNSLTSTDADLLHDE